MPSNYKSELPKTIQSLNNMASWEECIVSH